ncbi:MAG: hypothetical protein H7A38_00545 [Chlamydiales bacterium]|nr:hypothetical protein [Chlamydiales bacterium]
MEGLSPASTPPVLLLPPRKDLPTAINSKDDALALLKAHINDLEEQALITQFTAEYAVINESNRDAFKHVYDAAQELLAKESDDSTDTTVLDAIVATYALHKKTLDAAWGSVDPSSKSPEFSASRAPVDAPKFVSQADTRTPVEGHTFDVLQTYYMADGKTFSFETAGLRDHAVRIPELFDRRSDRPITKEDCGAFKAVLTKFSGAQFNTIEGQIRSKFLAIWNELKRNRQIPFTFEQAQEIDALAGGKDLRETFSMLQVPPSFFKENGLTAQREMIIALLDGTVNRYDDDKMNLANAAIAVFLTQFKTPDKGSIAAKIKARLLALLTQKPTTPAPKPTPTAQGRSWGKILFMGAAAVLAVYLANRFVVPKVQQWYRGNNTQA